MLVSVSLYMNPEQCLFLFVQEHIRDCIFSLFPAAGYLSHHI